jgi:hypothetical protein
VIAGTNPSAGYVYRNAIQNSLLDAFTRRGVRVMGWAAFSSIEDPTAMGRWIAQVISDLNLSAFIVDPENEPYEHFSGVDTWASRQLVSAIRAGLGGRPVELALSLPVHQPGTVFDFTPYVQDGYQFLPQCYLHTGSQPTVAQCVATAQASFPGDRVHPTFGFYPWSRVRAVPLSEYLAGLPGGTIGWNAFVSDYLTDADWATARTATT